MICYDKLFELLRSRGLRKKELLKVMSPPTLAKFAKHESITTDVINKVCAHLGCQPGDIMEYREDPEASSMNKTGDTSL
jgi:DNA-binding Xre family transcriptional regulator